MVVGAAVHAAHETGPTHASIRLARGWTADSPIRRGPGESKEAIREPRAQSVRIEPRSPLGPLNGLESVRPGGGPAFHAFAARWTVLLRSGAVWSFDSYCRADAGAGRDEGRIFVCVSLAFCGLQRAQGKGSFLL